MVLETDIPSFAVWFPGALLQWVLVVGGVGAGALVGCWLVAALRHGPRPATRSVFSVLIAGLSDLVRISPRRVLALTWLAIKESIRRRVVVVFAVFIVLLSFAGWFLDPGSSDPAALYLDFVLTATSYLVLLLGLLLSSLSLPADIKNRTLHTVVTKPVRPSEVVLGRMLGFMAVGTGLLVVMGLVSYVFVVRGLAHSHELTEADLRPAHGAAGLKGKTSRVHEHRHGVQVSPSGEPHLEMEQGHWHELTANKDDGKTSYHVGPAEGLLVARVPVYGKLHFRSRKGKEVEKGINVGDEWTYRSYIEGLPLAAAIWNFQGITAERFPQGLPVEMTLGIFRTHKGKIERGVLGSLSVRNPRTGRKVEAKVFPAKEFETDVQFIPRTLRTSDGRTCDLFEDLVDDGNVEIWLQCLELGQYFGAAQADLYLRARDASFELNVAKGYLGIWLQLMLLTVLGVTLSTFLSGPIAMLATLGALVAGLYSHFMTQLARGEVIGGGPVEAFQRMITQENLVTKLEPGLRTTVIQMTDQVLETVLGIAAAILPEFPRFSFANYVAHGFDVSGNLVLCCVVQTLGFVVPMFIAGYFFLKTREVAQ